MAATWTARESAPARSRRALLISLLFGLVSAFLIFRLLTGAQGKGTTAGLVPVLVARQDIPARTTITDSMVAIKQVPSDVRLDTAFIAAKPAIGQASRTPILAGEQVLPAKLADAQNLGFSGSVPEGMRAISIPVTEVTTGGGLIQPGDHVDVIGVFQTGEKADAGSALGRADADVPKRFVALTVLQDVPVLAIAQQITDPTTNTSGGKSTTKGVPEAKSATLAVSPDDAERLFLADNLGTLRLTVHRFGDKTIAAPALIKNSISDITGGVSMDTPSPLPTPPASATATPRAFKTP